MSVILEELLCLKCLDSFGMDIIHINGNLCCGRIKNTSFKCNVAFWNGSIISSCSNLHTFICIFIGFTFAAFFRHAISALRCSANNPVQFFSQNNGFKNQFWITSWYEINFFMKNLVCFEWDFPQVCWPFRVVSFIMSDVQKMLALKQMF